MKIKEMVTSEMPRERLLSHGAKSLSNTELLAILINTGRKGFSSIDISNELLKANSNLNELKKSISQRFDSSKRNWFAKSNYIKSCI